MFSEFQSQCAISIPTIVGLLFNKIPWMISLHFVGRLGHEALAAAALATTLCNITGMSSSVGLSSALMTLAGQARGHLLKFGREKLQQQQRRMAKIPNCLTENHVTVCDVSRNGINDTVEFSEISPLFDSGFAADVMKKYNDVLEYHPSCNHVKQTENFTELTLLPLVFFYRGLLVSLTIAIPIGLWWVTGIDRFLLFLGQSNEVSQMTSDYLRILVPGFWGYTINWTTNAWLQSINMANVPAYSAFVGLLLHIPTNIFFINIMGYGYKGVAMATVSFQVVQTFMIFMYLFGTEKGRNRILENIGAKQLGRNTLFSWAELKLAISSVTGLKQYLALGLPGMISISEWWASECCIFLAGTLHPYSDRGLGAMSIYQSINTFCFIFPLGFSTASSARVAMFLGKNQPSKAEFSAWMGLCYASLNSSFVAMILFFTRHTIFPSLFTSDDEVLLQCSYTIPFLAFYVFADGIQCGLQGAIKGCGKQYIMAPIVLFSYWVVGVPLSYYVTFMKNNGTMECGLKDMCGVRGLVLGLLSGTWMHMFLMLGVFVFSIDWNREAQLAQERLAIHSRGYDIVV